MRKEKVIRVLVVDDSAVFREALSQVLSSDPEIEVIAKASDPFEARDKILEYTPDVMVCDVEMPKMNGIEFIRRLLPQHPLPVIVISSVSEAVFEALEAGAIDFVPKPGAHISQSVNGFFQELIGKIKVAASAQITVKGQHPAIFPSSTKSINKKIIAIGASTGGTEALYEIIKVLPQNVPGLVVVQHIPPVFSRMFAERLNNQTQLWVKEGETGDEIEAGKVIIAPGDRHMLVHKVGKKLKIECAAGKKINGHCPSVDVLFESVAVSIGKQSIGVILTGMGSDGAKGLLKMKEHGARTIGQDEKSSVVYGMPKAAYNMGAVEKQVPLGKIPKTIFEFLDNKSWQ